MKVSVYSDEWFPVYWIDTTPTGTYFPIVEVPDELIERHERAREEFEKVQDELEQYYTTERVKQGEMK